MCEDYSKFESRLRSKRLSKKLRKKVMKNGRKCGKSVRNGNAPSPYSKYNKKPYQYTTVKRFDNASAKSGATVAQQVKSRKYSVAA